MANDIRTHQVSLGCGTLILIALIVLFFSNRTTDELEREIHALHAEIGAVKKLVEAQTIHLTTVEAKLDKLAGPPGAGKGK